MTVQRHASPGPQGHVADAAEVHARTGRAVPDATVARLATYFRVLGGFRDGLTVTVSSDELAAAAGVNSAMLRKDLSYLGSYGIRGVGYDVITLTEEIARVLGLTVHRSVALIGVGNLGQPSPGTRDSLRAASASPRCSTPTPLGSGPRFVVSWCVTSRIWKVSSAGRTSRSRSSPSQPRWRRRSATGWWTPV